MQYVQCFEFFLHFIFPVFQNLRNHSYIALGGKPIAKRKRMSVFSYSQRFVKLATMHSLLQVSNDHRLCKRTIFSVKVQNNTYIIISHQSFSYRFPFIFDNSSFHCNLEYCSVQGIPLGFQNSIRHFEGKTQKCQFAVLIILMGAC